MNNIHINPVRTRTIDDLSPHSVIEFCHFVHGTYSQWWEMASQGQNTSSGVLYVVDGPMPPMESELDQGRCSADTLRRLETILYRFGPMCLIGPGWPSQVRRDVKEVP